MAEASTTRNHARREHLAKVRALSQELSSAVMAVQQNDLKKLESSLALQETLCHELATKWLLPPATAGETAKSGEMTLVEEIREAHLSLAQLNRVYAAVLKRARRSTGLIAGIYRNYGQGYAKDAPAVGQRHTWSCEV